MVPKLSPPRAPIGLLTAARTNCVGHAVADSQSSWPIGPGWAGPMAGAARSIGAGAWARPEAWFADAVAWACPALDDDAVGHFASPRPASRRGGARRRRVGTRFRADERRRFHRQRSAVCHAWLRLLSARLRLELDERLGLVGGGPGAGTGPGRRRKHHQDDGRLWFF